MKFSIKFAAAAASLLLIGTAAVTASASVTPKTYFACLKDGNLSHVALKKPKCPAKSKVISWSNVGPAGAPGLQGEVGPSGAPGPAGSDGSNGYSKSYIFRGTLELPENTLQNSDPDARNGIMKSNTANRTGTLLPQLPAGNYFGTVQFSYFAQSGSPLTQVAARCYLIGPPNYTITNVYLRTNEPSVMGDTSTGVIDYELPANSELTVECRNQVNEGLGFNVDYSLILTKVNSLSFLTNDVG